ncbi:hypothetical protein [Marinobacterium stanieri]|uniref:Uncharacterized protein n=1 Tax=Marinobacterium stanieri TaxID=49186 RepID=A0A1N6NW27_9GAMM|nr:hypothetical protein [Marinobacterium stanieri]SIP96206.1 hypothetical protein SAMN05421647_101596 [Marinobacterium stanieri]
MIKRILAIISVIFSASVLAGELSEPEVYWVTVGEKAPEILTKNQSTSSPFLLVTVPVKVFPLKRELPDLNVFVFPESKMVSGLRGDRVFETIEECEASKTVIAKVLVSLFPLKYIGEMSKYQFKSKSGKTIAGVSCVKLGAFVDLSVEVTNPELEKEMMKNWR